MKGVLSSIPCLFIQSFGAIFICQFMQQQKNLISIVCRVYVMIGIEKGKTKNVNNCEITRLHVVRVANFTKFIRRLMYAFGFRFHLIFEWWQPKRKYLQHWSYLMRLRSSWIAISQSEISYSMRFVVAVVIDCGLHEIKSITFRATCNNVRHTHTKSDTFKI